MNEQIGNRHDEDAYLRSSSGLDPALLLQVMARVRAGDFEARLPLDATGAAGKVYDELNAIIALNQQLADELCRVSRRVGQEGVTSERMVLGEMRGSWRVSVDAVNSLVDDLAYPTADMARVIGAIAKGDLTQRMALEVQGRPLRGQFLSFGSLVNDMVDQLAHFSSEVTRVAREVRTEGKLGGQANVIGASGTWKDLTDNVNLMASNLTDQVRNITEVTTAVANGDLTKKITVDVKGEILELKNTINTMVDQLGSFADEVTRVAREVGTEGRLGGQANVKGVSGTWKDLTDNVNLMASNLTAQVRNIAEVTTAVANGDLTKKITVDVKGEILELKNTINTMVDQLGSFADEVTRVAREVGTEGRLGGQAHVKGVSGTWKDLTDNVNLMASNLTDQVRNIADVTTAVATGDLSRKITVNVRGEILELKNTINTMVDQLSSFADEVTRVAREVGTDGKLGGQAVVVGVSGTWKDLTDNVNSMAAGITAQVRTIAEVTTAVANGDLSKKITVDVKGEILELKDTINTMVDQLSSFADEVTRVAREVGTEGKLGGQAQVRDVRGIWKDLTNNVNLMASNLTSQVRNIAEVTTAVANGDLSKKITVDVKGEMLELKDTINTMVEQLSSFADEVTRVAREVGTEGRLGGQAHVKGVAGTWKGLTDNVNLMASNLTAQVRNVAEVTTAVASGDLSRKITVDVKGEMLELKNTINTMVDQLRSFASEVTRVAREVGTEGKLGGQAHVAGVGGTWKDLTQNVNSMASNLTDQVRGIARVVTAVAAGDLKQKLALEAKGEIAALADTINGMIDTLAIFADQVTGVAREVGIEGKLGGQARVPGAMGIWRDLTDNVNQLADNLTTQVRSIAEVATAVTKGDLTRSIAVQAQGEVAALKDNINQMIANLRETTHKNDEQDWFKTNLARFTGMLQGQRDLATVSSLILEQLAPLVDAHAGLFFLASQEGEPVLHLLSSYACPQLPESAKHIAFGEGLTGQCAVDKRRILMTDVPNDYLRVSSGLGETTPRNVVVLPVTFEDDVKAVVELASLKPFTDIHVAFLDQLTESIGIVLNTIAAGMRTEQLLEQSQSLTEELRRQKQELTETNTRLEEQTSSLRGSEELLKAQQEQLRHTNEELESRSQLLEQQKAEVERKNREIEQAKHQLEERAQQLALTSRYKSEFLANMSHELRTPLNSLLILARMLADNPDGGLTAKQVEFAEAIHSGGTDLLLLINDILDLSKIESGTMAVTIDEVPLSSYGDFCERTFRQVAHANGLSFDIVMSKKAPATMYTDPRRVQQVLKNLLSNAFKFTDEGKVTLLIEAAEDGWSPDNRLLWRSDRVVAFRVSDTGVGIPHQKQSIIFEAFQQADGSTSRRFGGTGLGLSISREIARLLGGELVVSSAPGEGSTFTLYLPRTYVHESTSAAASLRGEHPRRPVLATTALESEPPTRPHNPFVDDRNGVAAHGDKVLLASLASASLARHALDLGRSSGLRVITTSEGESSISCIHEHRPDAVILDLSIPGFDGWTALDRLKHDPRTRHIPLFALSNDDGVGLPALRRGACGFLSHPVEGHQIGAAIADLRRMLDPGPKRLLVVEPVEHSELVIAHDPRAVSVVVAREDDLTEHLSDASFDCALVSNESSAGVRQQLMLTTTDRGTPLPLVVVGALGDDWTDHMVVREAGCGSEVVYLTSLFLHLPYDGLPPAHREMLRQLRERDSAFRAKKILVVDDDVRNIFAITSLLERHGAEVLFAEDGRKGIEVLEDNPDVDVVLMDIMMPHMDGYETMRAIRQRGRFVELPIIALTAKAMAGDREKCVAAGASDYITKPVENDQLLATLRVWLSAKSYKTPLHLPELPPLAVCE